jgi:hypothetical protein
MRIRVCMIGENKGGVCDKNDLTNAFYYGKIFSTSYKSYKDCEIDMCDDPSQTPPTSLSTKTTMLINNAKYGASIQVISETMSLANNLMVCFASRNKKE